MINPNILIKEKMGQLPLEAVETLGILDELENFTLELREKLASELNPEEVNSIKLKLDKVS
jgi:hypothetical protein